MLKGGSLKVQVHLKKIMRELIQLSKNFFFFFFFFCVLLPSFTTIFFFFFFFFPGVRVGKMVSWGWGCRERLEVESLRLSVSKKERCPQNLKKTSRLFNFCHILINSFNNYLFILLYCINYLLFLNEIKFS